MMTTVFSTATKYLSKTPLKRRFILAHSFGPRSAACPAEEEGWGASKLLLSDLSPEELVLKIRDQFSNKAGKYKALPRKQREEDWTLPPTLGPQFPLLQSGLS